ncbi:DNA polymerase III subunit beta [Vibrio xuii]|nr:DNA polymerase III subunit beta [Vibrio xuii]
MKKVALVSLGVALLAGCATQQVGWEQDNQAVIAESTVTLKSNLWLNKMPTIGEVQDNTLHGALYLESDSTLPAELDVENISIQQGEETWVIDGDLLEMRTHSPNQWEVVFVWQFPVDPNQPVNVALLLNNNDKVEWLVENNVKIDTVY